MLIIPVQDATVLLNMFVAIIWHFNQQVAALSTSQILTLENGWTNCETATAVVRPLLAGMTVITTRQQQNQQTTADCLSTRWCSVHYSVATNAMFTSLLTTRTLWLMKKFYFCFDFGPHLAALLGKISALSFQQSEGHRPEKRTVFGQDYMITSLRTFQNNITENVSKVIFWEKFCIVMNN